MLVHFNYTIRDVAVCAGVYIVEPRSPSTLSSSIYHFLSVKTYFHIIEVRPYFLLKYYSQGTHNNEPKYHKRLLGKWLEKLVATLCQLLPPPTAGVRALARWSYYSVNLAIYHGSENHPGNYFFSW